MALIKTNGQDWSTVDDRCQTHDGVIVDLGCLGWDWSSFFFGRKRVIGADPFERSGFIGKGKLVKCFILPYNSALSVSENGLTTSAFDSLIRNTDEVQLGLSWKKFCEDFDIMSVSILKMNIEGGEYPLLNSMDSNDFAQIDQLAISFHDWNHPEWKKLTEASIYLIKSEGFDAMQINKEYNWWLFRKINNL